MKTIINYFNIKRDKSIWIDPQGNQVCIKETSWFDGINFNPMVYYYYITPNKVGLQLLTIDRYTFAKYMSKLNDK